MPKRWIGSLCARPAALLAAVLGAFAVVTLAAAQDAAKPAPTVQSPDWQATIDDGARAEAQKRLEEQQRAIEVSRQQESTLESSIEQLGRERSQLTDQLVATAKRVQLAESELSEVERQLNALTTNEARIRTSLKLQRSLLVKLLAALQRMGRDPPPILITERSDALKMVRSAMELAAVFPQLKDKATALARDLADLEKTIADIRVKNAQRLADRDKLLEEQQRLDGYLERKRLELASRGGELAKLHEVVNDQAKSIASLTELIVRSDRVVAFKGTLGDADKQLQEQATPPESKEPVLPPDESGTDTPTVEPPKKLASLGEAVPGQTFERAKGHVPLPVQGQRILKFGDPTKNVGRSKGEVYSTRPHAQITSPCDGLVVFAGQFRTFGQILIINAGGGYHVLLAGLGQLDAITGQSVVAGVPVGKMGEGAGSGSGTANPPILYVEFRSRDKPINPSPWWAGDAEKVQG